MSRSAGMEDVHRWSRLRMPALRLGLLEGTEEARLREHLASCASCQESYAAIMAERQSGEPPGEHIPADLIARWPQTAASLRGIERAAVRSHLEHCAECRQDLELLGYQPTLERIVGLESEAEVGLSVSSQVQPPETPVDKIPAGDLTERPSRTVRVLVRRPDVWSRAARWAIGGWALAATAAAFLLVFRPPVRPRGADLGQALPAPSPEAGSSSRPVTTGSASTRGASLARAGAQLLPAIVPQLSFATRDGGGEESVVTTRVPPDARVLVLPAATEALAGMRAAEPVLVELVAPSGKSLLSERLTLGRMREERVLVYELGTGPVESGVYRLKFGAGDEEVEARFRLEANTGK